MELSKKATMHDSEVHDRLRAPCSIAKRTAGFVRVARTWDSGLCKDVVFKDGKGFKTSERYSMCMIVWLRTGQWVKSFVLNPGPYCSALREQLENGTASYFKDADVPQGSARTRDLLVILMKAYEGRELVG